MPSNENPAGPVAAGRGANSQRQPAAPARKGGRPKKNGVQPAEEEEDPQLEIARLKAKLAESEAANKNHQAHAARGVEPAREEIVRLERPKGEAGDRKNGFVLINAMGLEDDPAQFTRIQAALHTNVVRANLDVEVDYRRQDPAKLAAAYKLVRLRIKLWPVPHNHVKTRKEFPFLTEKRFPLNWGLAEMAKQYLRNKRKYAVRLGRIPNRKERKRRAEENTAQGRSKRRRITDQDTGVPHIDEGEDDPQPEEEDDDSENEDYTGETTRTSNE
ncbi:hypothetical protein K438DRAFT_2132673 [Mycena galopus ATCC 62051]|nr:hypothetical protein K438DRAFT_2132673 [Mycena galopus ATCC 62051]